MPIPAFLGPLQPVPNAPGNANPAPPLTLRIEGNLPSNWCWAATAAAVHNFYENAGMSACRIATSWLNQGDCCSPPVPPGTSNDTRNKPFDIEAPLGNRCAGIVPRALNPAQLQAEIANGNPVCCYFTWDGSDVGHYNLVVGYDPVTGDVGVLDCVWDGHWLDYNTFCTAYQHIGTWHRSFRTQ